MLLSGGTDCIAGLLTNSPAWSRDCALLQAWFSVLLPQAFRPLV